MSIQKLAELKERTLKVKNLIEDENLKNVLEANLNNENGIINGTAFNYRDFLVCLNTWNTNVIEADNYLELSPFIDLKNIDNIITGFNNIFNALTAYKNNNFNLNHLQTNQNPQVNFDNLKSYMLFFLPYVKGDIAKATKKQWDFRKEQEAINKHQADAKKLYEDLKEKEKEITEFHSKLLDNNSSTTDEKRGIKGFIEDSFNEIMQKYDELFVKKQNVKIGEEDIAFDGLIGKTERYIKFIESKAKTISELESDSKKSQKSIEMLRIEFKLQIGDTLTAEEQKYIEAAGPLEQDTKGIKKTKEEYEKYMEDQTKEIAKMNFETKKSLGDHVNTLMVKTFQKEADSKEKEARFMFRWSIGFIVVIAIFGLIWIFGFNIDGVELYKYGIRFVHGLEQNVNNVGQNGVLYKDGIRFVQGLEQNVNNVGQKLEWITFAYRAMIFLPLGLGFWFCNKRHDILSLLAAEYKYKCSIVEAMIGYRENYETSRDQFKESFTQEYTKFFDKTFEEINKNPAEKINKMLMKNKFSVESLIDKALDDKKKDKNYF